MMSRPLLLVFLLLILIITSQFEWRQQVVDLDAAPTVNQKHHQISKREEAVKEKIILLQEKNIRRLNELVRSLQKQLLQCTENKKTRNSSLSHMTGHVIELERLQILED